MSVTMSLLAQGFISALHRAGAGAPSSGPWSGAGLNSGPPPPRVVLRNVAGVAGWRGACCVRPVKIVSSFVTFSYAEEYEEGEDGIDDQVDVPEADSVAAEAEFGVPEADFEQEQKFGVAPPSGYVQFRAQQAPPEQARQEQNFWVAPPRGYVPPQGESPPPQQARSAAEQPTGYGDVWPAEQPQTEYGLSAQQPPPEQARQEQNFCVAPSRGYVPPQGESPPPQQARPRQKVWVPRPGGYASAAEQPTGYGDVWPAEQPQTEYGLSAQQPPPEQARQISGLLLPEGMCRLKGSLPLLSRRVADLLENMHRLQSRLRRDMCCLHSSLLQDSLPFNSLLLRRLVKNRITPLLLPEGMCPLKGSLPFFSRGVPSRRSGFLPSVRRDM